MLVQRNPEGLGVCVGVSDPGPIGDTPKTEGDGMLLFLDDYRGGIMTRCALQLAPLVFVRPVALRHAEWSECNLGTAEWR